MNTILLEVDELTNGLESENIPKLLQDKDILSLSKLKIFSSVNNLMFVKFIPLYF